MKQAKVKRMESIFACEVDQISKDYRLQISFNKTRVNNSKSLCSAALPVFGEVSPSFLIQKNGETVDIFCEANGNPDPTLTWYKDGREMAPTDRVSIGNNRIQLTQLGPDDGGLYNCTFRNIIGQISHAIRLVIEGESVLVRVFSSSFPASSLTNMQQT